MTKPESALKRSRPTCGMISLVLPLVVAGVGYIAVRSAPEGDSGTLGTFILAAYALVASMIGGIVLAIIALARREKWRALPCICLVLNAIGLAVLVKQFF